MNYVSHGGDGSVNLQATLSASSALSPLEAPTSPHHPITCPSQLSYDEQGTFACEHTSVPPEDVRTRLCIDHSVALLIIELSKGL
jgi:hypothetical protein